MFFYVQFIADLQVDCDIDDILNACEHQTMNPGLRAIWEDPRLAEVAQQSDNTIVERVIIPSERERSYLQLLWKFLGIEAGDEVLKCNRAADIEMQDVNVVKKESCEEQLNPSQSTKVNNNITIPASQCGSSSISVDPLLHDSLIDAAADLLREGDDGAFEEADSILFAGPSKDEDLANEKDLFGFEVTAGQRFGNNLGTDLECRESYEMSQVISDDIFQEESMFADETPTMEQAGPSGLRTYDTPSVQVGT